MPATNSKAAQAQVNAAKLADALKPCSWDRLPDETADQFYWFKVFRDLGPGRRIADVVNQYGKSGIAERSHQIYNISSINNWVDRATAYDNWCAEQIKQGSADALRIQGKLIENNRRVFK